MPLINNKQLPILLKNCDIQINKFSKSLEVVIKSYTTAKFDTSIVGTTTISLSELCTMNEFDKVNVKVKVIDIKP